jgi:hypothetical protein
MNAFVQWKGANRDRLIKAYSKQAGIHHTPADWADFAEAEFARCVRVETAPKRRGAK